MNKLTKVGLSALCGSLAAMSSANAGDLTVTGGADMSWSSVTGTTGNPIGIGSNVTFAGSGELDNGWTFSLSIAMLNLDAYSSSNIDIVMGGLGELNFDQGDSGNGIDEYDDKMPTAWEEPWGNVLGTGVQLVTGVGKHPNIQYTFPTVAGITLKAAMAPDMGSADVSDKGTSGNASGGTTGRGYDVTMNINPSFGTEILSGLNIFAGASQIENYVESATISNNRYEGVGGVTFDIGPISVGYATSGISTGLSQSTSQVDWYKNHMFGIAFNINDDLSVSYGDHESRVGHTHPDANGENNDLNIESWQIAYTMGGASVRLADTEVSNAAYQTGAAYDKDAKILSVSLAF